MPKITRTQGISQKLAYETYLPNWIEAFMIDRRAQGLANGSLVFYRKKLRLFSDFCEAQLITQIDQIDATFVRQYLLYLQERGHNPGGVHAGYRALRAFLNWYEHEEEPEYWKNPMTKVRAPRVGLEPLEPVDEQSFKDLLAACDLKTFAGQRDHAIFLMLLDTGVRAGELLAIDLDDLDIVVGSALVRKGKGRKPRIVFLGRKTRKALRSYLRSRTDDNPAVWVTVRGHRLKYDGLREMVKRRAHMAGIPAPTLHAFRRAFALAMLRAGTDIFTLAKLMGHSSIVVLQRYLKQTTEDVQTAHRKNGPVDKLL